MYDFMCKNKGAVSIFLVIVLVPMLVFSSIFVDMSRLTLAKSVAESSGELTLNTALTNYDAVLKDMYGLFATSQNTDELFENLENYYKQCIEAAGVAEADAEDYVAQIMDLLKSETGRDDLLNMNLAGFEVTKPTGGSLANPAILKSQIVEFMKYRGPINLGSGIFDALSSLKNVKKQSELVDNKNKFYAEQTSMMEDLESLWNDLEDYQYRDAYTWYEGDKCTFPDGEYLLKSYERMKDCIESLQISTTYVARYLYFADGNYSVASSGTKDFKVTKSDSSDENYSVVWTVSQTAKQEYNIEAEPKAVSISTLKADLKSAYNAIQALKSYSSIVQQLSVGNSVSDTEKIKIVSTFNSSLGSGYHSSIKNLVGTLVQLKNSYAGCKDDITKHYVIVNSNNTLSFTEDPEVKDKIPMKKFIEDQLGHLTLEQESHIYLYNILSARINGFWNDTVEIVKNARTYVTNSTKMAQSCASSFDSFLECKIKKLDSALIKISAIHSELTNTESAYNKALAAWKKSANGLSGETMGANDLSEIAKLEKVLTVEKVKALQTRVQNARDSLDSLKKQVAEFKVLGKEWKDLGVASNGKVSINYNTLKNLLSSTQKNEISGVQKPSKLKTETINDAVTAKYDEAYNTIANKLKATVTSTEIKTDWTSEPSKAPNLTKDQVKLYTWLYSNFCDKDSLATKYDKKLQLENYTPPAETDKNTTTDVSSNKNNADKSQNAMDGEAKEYNEKTAPTMTAPDREYLTEFLPSGEWKETVLEVMKGNSDTPNSSDTMLSGSTGALGIFDGVLELVGDMATTLRDDLYICSYIMNMFSYSTYEAEITVDNGNDISAFSSWYEWNATENKYTLRTDFSTAFKNSSQMLKDARTMTKVSINPNANYLYGKEVEYIIYGDNGVAKSYGTIYMIRFALNTVYAFMDAEIGNITTAAATAIFGTPPLTPLIPVAKIAMTIGLALAESAYDLYQLKCGEAIPLMKNNSTWVMKPTNAAKAIAGEIFEDVADAAIDQGVKVLNDALNMTDEELKKLIDSQKGEFDALVDATLDSTMNELKNYGNQAVQEMVNICNQVNSEAMELKGYVQGQTEDKIKSAIEKLDDWLETQGSSESDVVYMAKKTAVDYLKENNGKVIGDLFDKIGSVGDQATQNVQNLGQQLEIVLDDIQQKINSKILQLSNQAGNALHNLRTKAVDELKAAAAEGAESLRSALKDKIGATFGTSDSASKGASSVVSSLLSWKYSDYLQLFLLIGIVASPESVLLRTADVIELNMQQIDGNPGYVEVTTETEVSRLWGLIKYTKTETKTEANDKAFKLSKSYTYLNIRATIEVKPMMLTMPLIADTVKSQLTGTNWYQFVYEGTMGY